MRLSNTRNQGFTLIEIIIVVVILGILAAIALPKITSNVDKARAAEAFQVAGAFKAGFNRCIDEVTGGLRAAVNADLASCDTFTEVGFSAAPAANNFTYNITTATTIATLTADGNFAGNGANDNIIFTFDAATGAVTRTCVAAGRFAQMCK